MKKNKLVYGMGINDSESPITKSAIINGKKVIIWKCPVYPKWSGMLSRCYSKKHHLTHPTYADCSVCDEWLLFSTFKKWMEQQVWEGRQLDKDFLVEGNKVYSPSTCIFLPHKLNSFTLTCGKAKGLYPIGVRYHKKHKDMINEYAKPYSSQISDMSGGVTTLGMFSTPEEAHQAYLSEKLKQCESYLIEFKEEPLTVRGLTRIKDKIQYHIDNNLELTEF